MISALLITSISTLLLAYTLYKIFSVPDAIKDVPAISLTATLSSMLRGESFDLRFEKLIRPALTKSGIARLWNQGHWELLFGDAKQAKEILTNTREFPKRKEDDINLTRTLISKAFGFTNILASDGDEWRRHRRIANPAFKKTWSTEKFGACTDDLVALIKSSDLAPLQVQDLFQRLTLDVLGKGLFSYDFEAISKGNKNHYLRLYNDLMKGLFNPIYTIFPLLETLVPSRQISHQKGQEFRNFLRGIIRGRKAELTDSHDDLLSLMTKASVDDAKLDEDDVINDLSIFFLAGHDTTANTLTTIFYYLSKHPDIQEKARKEVNAVLKGEKRIPTAEELKELHYIDCIIKESMRIVSTVQQLRRYCKDGKTLSNGFTVPKDMYVNLQLWNIHHDEKVYPDPYAFNPDRFKEAHSNEEDQWMAFGFGSRMCIGKNFSLMEQRITLASLLQSFNFMLGPNVSKISTPTLSYSGLIHPVDVDIIFEPLA
ncbi:hypothetical protein DSO57_1029739 [Entomophthora muscae]|uniref:Uncharacterized protein n=2 Tax=Entomophthora muscae TaxID=34485 RepID=A0ACC2U0L2_9FUNG|nr:hypothetical protein DSO57_1029738 [Entomophthora muscae]KAJ9079997.1 hypothetical protein DSO57_1029739 [Entomophthora muscae]